jgi:hypothetical protein
MSTNQAIFNDPRAKRWGNFAKFGALLTVGFFVAPYIWVAIGGILGLIVAAIVLTAAWVLRPWFYSVAANARLAFVKAEARKNPVLTLEEDLRRKTVALNDRQTNIEKLAGQIRTFADKVDEIKQNYGEKDAGYVKLSRDLVDLKRLYKHRCDKWNEARRQLTRFAEEIDRAKMIWEAGLAAQAARETSGLTEDEFFAKLKTETAFDSIQDSYNQALASLDAALVEDDKPAAATTAAA